MPWIKIDLDLPDIENPKLEVLCETTGLDHDTCLGLLIRWFCWVRKHHETGCLVDASPFKAFGKFQEKSGKFQEALCKAGFVKDGWVKNWPLWGGAEIMERARKNQVKYKSMLEHYELFGFSRKIQENPGKIKEILGNSALEEKREDKIRLDNKETPPLGISGDSGLPKEGNQNQPQKIDGGAEFHNTKKVTSKFEKQVSDLEKTAIGELFLKSYSTALGINTSFRYKDLRAFEDLKKKGLSDAQMNTAIQGFFNPGSWHMMNNSTSFVVFVGTVDKYFKGKPGEAQAAIYQEGNKYFTWDSRHPGFKEPDKYGTKAAARKTWEEANGPWTDQRRDV